jgi:hypothetical protein
MLVQITFMLERLIGARFALCYIRATFARTFVKTVALTFAL